MNDEEEFQHVLPILKRALDTRFGYQDAGFVRFREGFSKYINGTSDYISGNVWQNMTELFGESFVICFSTERDNLTLWSEFANQGCYLELNLWNILNTFEYRCLRTYLRHIKKA